MIIKIGIDVGIKDFAVCSNGERFENPRYLINKELKLKKLQRKLSKKAIGSKNRLKRRLKLAELHQKVSDARGNSHHQISHKITSADPKVRSQTKQ